MTKIGSNHFDVKLKLLKKDDNKGFQLVQNFTKREAEFNQFMRLRNQLVNAAENFGREENLSPVVIPTTYRDMDEQVKMAHKVIDVVERANRMNCVTLLRYHVDRPGSSFVQVRVFARKKQDKEFRQIVSENYKLEKFIGLLYVMNSVYDNFFTKKTNCNVL